VDASCWRQLPRKTTQWTTQRDDADGGTGRGPGKGKEGVGEVVKEGVGEVVNVEEGEAECTHGMRLRRWPR